MTDAMPAGAVPLQDNPCGTLRTPSRGCPVFRGPATRWAMRVVAPALVGGLVAGCALIDQDTFAPSPEARPVAQLGEPKPVPVDPRTPLVTIEYATPAPMYQEPLRYAVRAAEARDRRVQYDVVAVVPGLGQAEAGQARATEIMQAITAQRVPASRVHLGVREDPSLANPQVRVYVR